MITHESGSALGQTTPETRVLAQAVLDADDALRSIEDAEPALDDEGQPQNAAAWVRWHQHDYQPARARRETAHSHLERAIGPYSRHRMYFRPLCEGLLA